MLHYLPAADRPYYVCAEFHQVADEAENAVCGHSDFRSRLRFVAVALFEAFKLLSLT